MASATRWLIVGLGNPGPRYLSTRHNLGFMVVDSLAQQTAAAWSNRVQFKAEHASSVLEELDLTFIKPQTFMNLSGEAVRPWAQKLNITAANIIVVHDDLDLAYGQMRLKQGGGTGGHNGLSSIDSHLGTKDYFRIRLGVGRPPEGVDSAQRVLSGFSPLEKEFLPQIVELGVQGTRLLLTEGLKNAQNKTHGINCFTAKTDDV